MILVEVRDAGGARTIAVHGGATVIGGLDRDARRAWVAALTRALRGEDGDVEVEVEVDGTRRTLTPDLAQSLQLGDAAAAIAVFPADLPGARPREATPEATAAVPAEAASPMIDLASREAEVAAAEAHVAQLRKALADAQRAATGAADARTSAGRHVDRDAAALVAAAEQRLAAAQAAAAGAREALDQVAQQADARAAAAAQGAAQLAALRRDRARLEAERADLVARMVEGGDPGDPAPVTAALAALHRLRQVKPKPSAQGTELADRWVEAWRRLAALPQPPQPPEWLVTPALAALQEAREALAAAEAAQTPDPVDPARVEALDRAHREVLEAEQRAMKKGSRLNRRRLDAAHEAEQAALAALGVNTYGEYLQRVVPAADGAGREQRIVEARAALADAEAVWEELHGGQASPEWTAAKEEQAAVREEAFALLGREVDDADLEDALRQHLEVVVESGWAEQELATALAKAGAPVPEGEDVEEAAVRWLEESPAVRERRAALEAELSELDGRLAAVEEQMAEQQADDFFGEGEGEGEGEGDGGDGGARPAADPAVAEARREAEAAAEAVREAEQALAKAQERQAASDEERGRLAALEQEADARRADVDRTQRELTEAEQALQALRRSVADEATAAAAAPAPAVSGPTESAPPATAGEVDLSGVIGMEAEAYLLARVAALRGAPGGPLPLVVDVDAVAGLPDGAARRVLRLLGRLAESVQVVVVGDDGDASGGGGGKVATWAEGLGDRAAVRSVAR